MVDHAADEVGRDVTTFHTPFNRPFVVGKELHYIAQAVTFGNLGGDGPFTQKCCRLLEERFGIPDVLLTPSCTSALEIAAMLCDLKDGDEVIMPSFTFVSTANAFVRLGAQPVFVDVRPDTLNIDERLVEDAVSERTRAIVPVHYAGVGCEMDRLMRIGDSHGLMVIEDAAQGVNAFYKRRALGSIGHIGTYSFHETKNFIAGEGGALCVNDGALLEPAHVIRDKGTNRQRFLRGEVDKYKWVEIGGSHVPSELVSAFLYGQLEEMDRISDRRRSIYSYYHTHLEELENEGLLQRPTIPNGCTTNFHLYRLLLEDRQTRDRLAGVLARNGVQAITHYEPLHASPMGRSLGLDAKKLPVTESVAPRLLRLPMYHEITEAQQEFVVRVIRDHLLGNRKSGSRFALGQSNPGRTPVA